MQILVCRHCVTL